MISQIMLRSGTIIVTGLNKAFTLSGNYVLPAYPGFIVTKIPTVDLMLSSFLRSSTVFF